MAGRSSLAILVLLALAAPPLQAETFKWVDEKGVTNYSNAPPPSGKTAKSVRTVEDRISTYETDPSLKSAMQNYRRADYAEAEWLQRQQIMAMRAAYTDCPPYRPDCHNDGYRSGAYYPFFAFPAVRSTVTRQGFFPASFQPPASFQRPASFHRPHGARTSASHSFR